MHPATYRAKILPEVPFAHGHGSTGGPDAGPPTSEDRNSSRDHMKVRPHEEK